MVPVIMPAYEFRSTGIRVAPGAGWRDAPARLAVFTSPRAVRFGLACVDAGVLDETQIAAIGPATTAALEAAGVGVDLQAGRPYSTETLFAVPDFPAVPGQALIFAAPGGRQALREGLEGRGWKVHQAWVYERLALEPGPEAVAAIREAARVLSVWTSAAAMEWLLKRLPEEDSARVLAGVFIVASERLAVLANQLGASGVHVAAGADNANLFEAIEQLAG